MIFATLAGLAYYFIPAYVANACPPVLAKLFKSWDRPVDFGKTWNGEPLLGKNKTWRGIVGGTLLGGLVFLLQRSFLPIVAIPYDSLPWYTGFLLGFGAIFLGDCGESFLKRRFARHPGAPWIPFDQFDYTIGAFVVTFWLFWPGWPWFLALLLVNSLGTLLGHMLGYWLGLNKDRI